MKPSTRNAMQISPIVNWSASQLALYLFVVRSDFMPDLSLWGRQQPSVSAARGIGLIETRTYLRM